MSFNGSFTAVQSADGQSLTFTDTSTGSDGSLTGRRIYSYQASGDLLLPSGSSNQYIDWPIASSTLTVMGFLPKDYALSILVVWLSSNPLPSPSTYTSQVLYGFTQNTKNFIYNKLQNLDASPSLINDSNWQMSLFKLYNEVSNCDLAVAFGDLFKAQNALSRAQSIIANAQFNF